MDRPSTEVSATREPARTYYRQPQRLRPAPEPHEKYHIDPESYPEGCDVVWVPIKMFGMDTGQLRQYVEGGWIPARAADFPEHSGYGTQYPESVVRAKLVSQVAADDVIEKDGQMLFVRPSEYSKRADNDRLARAQEQVDTQMERLRLSSKLPSGSGRGSTEVKYGRQYANPDTLPEFRRSEEV